MIVACVFVFFATVLYLWKCFRISVDFWETAHLPLPTPRQQTFGADNTLLARDSNKMADLSLVACHLLLLVLLRSERARRVPRRHKFWLRQIYQKREELGADHTLVQELRLYDRVLPQRVFRQVRIL